MQLKTCFFCRELQPRLLAYKRRGGSEDGNLDCLSGFSSISKTSQSQIAIGGNFQQGTVMVDLDCRWEDHGAGAPTSALAEGFPAGGTSRLGHMRAGRAFGAFEDLQAIVIPQSRLHNSKTVVK